MNDWLVVTFLVFGFPSIDSKDFADGVANYMNRLDLGPMTPWTSYDWDEQDGQTGYKPSYRTFLEHARQGFLELYDSPPSYMADFLPPPRQLQESLLFNQKYAERCRQEVNYDLVYSDWWQETLEQTERLGMVYQNAHSASVSTSSYSRRSHLKELKRLWPTWYSHGTLPPPVPVWRMPEVVRD